MAEKEVIEYRDVFCPVCGTFFDLRQVGTEYRCRKCHTLKNCLKSSYKGQTTDVNGNRIMFTRSVVEFPGAEAWLDKTLASKNLAAAAAVKKREPESDEESDNDGIGAQRALVSEECQKCKNPKMYFWTQQLRSADEGQTIFYECPKCGNRLSLNS
jgi:DNA-directed RNA polymerase subunit M/transcription elongation factor TFIIS